MRETVDSHWERIMEILRCPRIFPMPPVSKHQTSPGPGKCRVAYDRQLVSSKSGNDYFNGLDLVDWPDSNSWIQQVLTSPVAHPWQSHLSIRSTSISLSMELPESDPPPTRYSKTCELRSPSGKSRDLKVHETVRFSDVQAFREESLLKLDEDRHRRCEMADDCRNMIYRYMDVVKGSLALLEAIHFEVFAPDRPDLRFITVPHVVGENLEGDYFTVSALHLLPSPSFAIRLGDTTYPVVWTTLRNSVRKGTFARNEKRSELAYVLGKKNQTTRGISCVSECLEEWELPDKRYRPNHTDSVYTESKRIPVRALAIDHHLWHSSPGGDLPQPHTIVRIETRTTSAAHLYPVEPPRDPGRYLKLLRGIRTTANRPGRVVCAARALYATEAAAIVDRLGPFDAYGSSENDDLKESLFRLGSRYRSFVRPRTDPRDLLDKHDDDDSVVVRALMQHRPASLTRPLLDCHYSKKGVRKTIPAGGPLIDVPLADGSTLCMNAQQSRALALCAADAAQRLACVQSAPGSGKTTIAAAAAAACPSSETWSPQLLLLTMQNGAVDAIAKVLKGMEHTKDVYNFKATERLDPFAPAGYDFFDYISEYELEKWRRVKRNLDEGIRRAERAGEPRTARKLRETYIARLDLARNKFEDGRWEMKSPLIILTTVELAFSKLLSKGGGVMKEALIGVRRIIVDEASLLTEAAMFGIVRSYPEAKIVLIGDKEQLPPFMYEETILGQELAGRSALDVAMSSHLTPVLTITEVYRAPQSLVEPYNRVAYDRQLVSRKREVAFPLSEIGLVPEGSPQLLFIQVEGREKRESRSMSLYNEHELATLERLLARFPAGTEDRVMIVCMYIEQKRKVVEMVGHKYLVLTVNSSQGQEKPVIIVLTTRTTHAVDMSFFTCRRRVNVAISRQQEALIIMGSDLLTECEPWRTAVVSDDFTRITSASI